MKHFFRLFVLLFYLLSVASSGFAASFSTGEKATYNPASSKTIISGLASVFLRSNGWNLANDLFQHAVWGNGETYSDPDGISRLQQAFASSGEILAFVRGYADQMEKGSQMQVEGNIEFKTGDLFYAVQHVFCSGTVQKSREGRYSANLTLTDIYDFDEIRVHWEDPEFTNNWHLFFSGIANDLGLLWQQNGLLVPFPLSVDIFVQEQAETGS